MCPLPSIVDTYGPISHKTPHLVQTARTSRLRSKQAIEIRFDMWRSVLKQAIGPSSIEPRCFSSTLKSQLYNENDSCSICGQVISHIDDSAVDHIEQYWCGGKTIDKNARLTHRFCNWSRSKDNVVKTQKVPFANPVGSISSGS